MQGEWKNILKKRFGENERRFYFDEDAGVYITIKRIPALKLKELTTLTGQLITNRVDPANPEKIIQQVYFSDEYNEFVKNKWRVLFENGIDKTAHNLEGETLDIKFWETFSKEFPAMFAKIENAIQEFNSLFPISEEDKKKS